MLNSNSALPREETPHTTSFSTTTLSDALKRRAQALIKDKSIDAQTRAFLRYGLEINDPDLPELVRRADNGESIFDVHVSSDGHVASSEEKVEALTEPDLRRWRGTFCRTLGPSIYSRKLHTPKSTRKHSQTPRLHSLRHPKPRWHGRRTDRND